MGETPARAAASVNAHAFALGRDIVLGSSAPDVGSAAGERLLAHEVAHTLQDGDAAPTLRRQDAPGVPQASPAQPMLELLTNAQFLEELIRANEGAQRSAVESERQRRVALGHAWLTADLAETPTEFRQVFPDSAGGGIVARPDPLVVMGAPSAVGGGRILTLAQFDEGLREAGIPTVALAALTGMGGVGPTPPVDSMAPGTVRPGPEGGANPFAGIESSGPAWRFQARPITEEALARDYGVDAATIPSGRIERLPGAMGSAIGPSLFGGGFFGPTPMSMVPANSTGLMWTQGHLSLFATPGGRSTIVGYRGNLGWYVGEALFAQLRLRSVRDYFTFNLNRGVPGSMRSDAAFTRMGGQQVVVYVPRDAPTAEVFAERLRTTEYGGDYRYSPPRPGATGTEGRMAERLEALGPRPQAAICTNNCITVPQPETVAAIGGRPRLTLPDGTVIDLMNGTTEANPTPDPYRTGRATDFTRWAEEGALPPGASRITFTPRAATLVGVIRVGGGLMLIYGAYRTQEHLRSTYGTPAFRHALGEETGAWSLGLLGSALGAGAATAGAAALTGAMGGGVICAPSGPVDLACVAIGAAGGLIGGFLFGTVGALIGGEAADATR